MAGLRSALSQLEALLWAGDAVIARRFVPGASAMEVESHLSELGLAPPPEITEWFGWHNGLSADMTGQPLRFADLAPGAEFYGLARLVDEFRSCRQVARDLAAHPQIGISADEHWDPSWLPLLRLFGKGFVVVDAKPRPTSPVHVMWHDDDDADRRRSVWPSLASFVQSGLPRDPVTSDLWCRRVPLEGCSPCPGPIRGSSART